MTEFVTKDSGQRQVFDSGMQRDTEEGKIKWHLAADGPMLRRYAELMTRGAEKYDERNWMQARGDEELQRFKASAFRHFMQWYFDEVDEDHAAAVFFNINGAEYVKGLEDADTPHVYSRPKTFQFPPGSIVTTADEEATTPGAFVRALEQELDKIKPTYDLAALHARLQPTNMTAYKKPGAATESEPVLRCPDCVGCTFCGDV